MDIVARTAAVFFFVFLVVRIMGRREISLSEPFDLIILVVLGDLIQQGITQSDNSLTGVSLVVSTLALLTILLSYLNYRSDRLRPLLRGQPIVLVQNGQPIHENLRRQRILVDEVLTEARKQQVARLNDIHWAILETNGTISIIPT